MKSNIISIAQATVEAAERNGREQAEKEIEALYKAMQQMQPENLDLFCTAVQKAIGKIIDNERFEFFGDSYKMAALIQILYIDMKASEARLNAVAEIEGERDRQRQAEHRRREAERHRRERRERQEAAERARAAENSQPAQIRPAGKITPAKTNRS